MINVITTCTLCFTEAEERMKHTFGGLTTADSLHAMLVKDNWCGSHLKLSESDLEQAKVRLTKTNNMFENITIFPVKTGKGQMNHPCMVGAHRWAYLAAGGVACGVCGTRP